MANAHSGPRTKYVRRCCRFRCASNTCYESIADAADVCQVTEAIKRLEQHGLVATRGHVATNGYEEWRAVRPTANGLRVLGEWPPAEGAAVNVALARILRALADSDIPDEDKKAARGAASTVASTAGEVVMDVVKEEMTRLATETAK
jgi:hypothetical protein